MSISNSLNSTSNSSSSSTTSLPQQSGITFSGLASGVDTNSIISKLLQADQIPITNLQNQETTIQTHQSTLNTLATDLQAIQAATIPLSSPSQFLAMSGTSSSSSVATITSSPSSLPGNYNLTITNLATAQKVASAAQTDTTSALNQSGTFVVNGHAINVVASDSLTTIAQNINSSGAGVTASIINGGTGSGYLTIASSQTGAANALQLADVSGGVLGNLGVLTGPATARSASGNTDSSTALSSSTTAVGTLMNLTSPPSGSFTINGGSAINVNLATDSLQTIANSINGSNSGVTATVVSSTNNGVTTNQLQITGTSGAPTFSDPNNLLATIGVVQQSAGNQLVAAQDAKYSLDGVNLTSSTNTVTTAIPGSTLTLLSGTPGTPGTTTLSVAANTQQINTNITGLVTAYNAAIDYITSNSQLNTSTFQGGPLFGDFTAEQVQQQLSTSLFNNVPGLTGTYKNLADIGFSLNQSGDIQVNQTQLSAALAADPSGVAAIFGSTGSSTSPNLNYVSSSSNTVSNGSAYAVNITQAATQSSYTAGTAQTAANPTAETLTFNGALLNNNAYNLNLDVNSTLAQTISKINSDSTLKQYLSASQSGGQLVLTSKIFGTAGNFSVVSNEAAANNNSGIGTGGSGTSVAGVDVAGTINGEAATGTGQFLTGNTGNATTSGLQLSYSGNTTGLVGSVTYSQGIAAGLNSLISQMTDPVSGIITAATQADTTQITDMNAQILQMQQDMQSQQTLLQQQFANMETTIAQFQQQAGQLSSITGGSSSSSSSSSGSSSSSA